MDQRTEVMRNSKYSFEETVQRLQEAAKECNFTVLAVHPVSETLKSKGFQSEPVSIVEVCNAKMAATALANDHRAALMMPCPIAVIQRDGGVEVYTMDTRTMSQMYEGPEMPMLGQTMYDQTAALLDMACD